VQDSYKSGSYTYGIKREPIMLRCRACGELKISWFTGILGCPPEVCKDCRPKEVFHKEWVSRDDVNAKT